MPRLLKPSACPFYPALLLNALQVKANPARKESMWEKPSRRLGRRKAQRPLAAGVCMWEAVVAKSRRVLPALFLF
jgi:hypothetical protein